MKKSLYFLAILIVAGCVKNSAPLCTITYPAQDAVFEIGDTVIISADASDTDGFIDEIRFFINDIGEASVNDFPYKYQWITAGKDSGAHVIKVVAYDDQQASESDEIQVRLIPPEKDTPENNPPVGYFTHPEMNDTIEQGAPVILSVEASDPDGDSVDVIFYIDGAGISSDQTYPYAYTWDTDGVSLGEHVLACKIKDEHAAESFDTVRIVIIKPLPTNVLPACEIYEPSNNEAFGIGDTVSIRVNATDEDGTIAEVRFFVNGTGVASDKDFPYEYPWKTGGMESGDYTLKAMAIDNEGGSAEDETSITLEASGNLPVADFSSDVTTVMEGDTVRFTDQTTNDPQSWNWDFGDGDYSTQQNPEKVYSTAGTYTVSLQAGNTYGTDLIEKTDYIIVEEFCMGCKTSTVEDVDGNSYTTVQIGHQWWMAENLDVKHYANGEAINYFPDSSTMWNATDPGYTYYQYNEAMYGDTYGALYNWWATVDSRNVCPSGWHVPLPGDWEALIQNLGGENVAGPKLKSTGGEWNYGNEDNTNESGFNALPSGSTEGTNQGYMTGYWTTEEENDSWAYSRVLYSYNNYFRKISSPKVYGYSIRCIKDKEE